MSKIKRLDKNDFHVISDVRYTLHVIKFHVIFFGNFPALYTNTSYKFLFVIFCNSRLKASNPPGVNYGFWYIRHGLE
jgi:hypothetical protein